MIIVDTNVISEVMRPQPSKLVINWLNEQNASGLYVTTITLAEIGYGIRILPQGRRRVELQSRFEQFISQAFENRILDFTETTAHIYAEIMGHRKEIGRPMSMADGQIASIARAHGFHIATRNTMDFADCGIDITDPFV